MQQALLIVAGIGTVWIVGYVAGAVANVWDNRLLLRKARRHRKTKLIRSLRHFFPH